MLAQPVFAAGDAADDLSQPEPPGFVPPNDGYDWLRLTSGEWPRGELIGSFDDEVEFDSDILDELTIDAEDIDQFHGQRVLGISVQGYELMTGRVQIAGDEIFVFIGDERLVFTRDHLIAITVSAERERDRWSGESFCVSRRVSPGNTTI